MTRGERWIRVDVDDARCVGSGTCSALSPDHMEMGDDGVAEPVAATLPWSEDIVAAIDGCPTGAISFVDLEMPQEG